MIPQDLRILVRVVSACTLGLWAFAGGLLIRSLSVFVIAGVPATDFTIPDRPER
jgi:hypothetical protein